MKKIIKILCIFLYLIVCFVSNNVISVFAEEEVEYTNVLDDLSKDKNFNSSNYKTHTLNEVKEFLSTSDKSDDFNLLEVIGLSEGNNKELFLYVYNPLRGNYDFNALSITLSCSENANPKSFYPDKKKLILCNSNGVFDKYLVDDFIVSSDSERYYNLIEINRPFIEQIDSNIDGSTIDEKAISVAKQFCCYFYNEQLVCESSNLMVLECDVIVNSFILFRNKYSFTDFLKSENEHGQVYYLVFEPKNFVISKIFDADLSYKYRSVVFHDDLFDNDNDKYLSVTDYIDKTITLYETDKGTYKGKGLKDKVYTWNRICDGKSFKETVNSQDGSWFVDPISNKSVEENILDSHWVFIYYNDSYSEILNYTSELGASIITSVDRTYVEVSTVDVFRIAFLDNNENYYNLGVVMDATTAKQINLEFEPRDYTDLLQMILMVLGLLILLFILNMFFPFISVIFDVLGSCFNYIFKFILYIVCFPFNLISKLFKKNKR